jgi:hypothetical protein
MLRVERGAGLVEEEHLGLVDQAEGDVQPAALPAGERDGRAFREPGQVEFPE